MKIINRNRQEKGITLIALVVTIIVLLILAGVSIAVLTGENGILNRAISAKQKNEEKQAEEELRLGISALTIDYRKNTTNTDSFRDYVMNNKQALANAMGVNQNEITMERETYTITYKGQMYIVEADGSLSSYAGGAGGGAESVVDYSTAVIGTAITNYSVTMGGQTISDWEVLYGNGEDLYIIAKNIWNNPDGKNNFGEDYNHLLTKNNETEYSETTLESSPAITAGLMSKMVTYLSNNTIGGQPNIKAVNYMLDATKWSDLVDTTKGADWAIGGPTMELLCTAYNAKNSENKEASFLEDEDFGFIGYDEGGFDFDEGMIANIGNVFNHSTDVNYWLASPYWGGAYDVHYVDGWNGQTYSYEFNEEYNMRFPPSSTYNWRAFRSR